MKKLLATFAILALCAVNAMAATPVTDSDTALVTVTVDKYVAVAIDDFSITATTLNPAGDAMTGSAPVDVVYSTNCAAAISLSDSEVAPKNYLTFPATVPTTSLGANKSESVLFEISVPLADGTVVPDITVTATIAVI